MNSTGYKLLGFAVWNGARWYVRRNYLSRLPSARVAARSSMRLKIASSRSWLEWCR